MQKPTTQAEAFIYYTVWMDIEMLDLILNDEIEYDVTNKTEFISKLGSTFELLQSNGNTSLGAHAGFCGSKICDNSCCSGYTFISNKSKHHFNLILKAKNGTIVELFECNDFEIINEKIQKTLEEFPFNAISYKYGYSSDIL
ncbi:MAG TPA: hypothetical protein PLJ42_08530 [Chitinophagales bacterium]|nr:hypothetical protein [Chitinophagales bacterium]HQW79466.1 hypothetical protein [Chitinophagales bacterium]HRB66875.1 hypothetical protein [Chitinophagales bacterium]